MTPTNPYRTSLVAIAAAAILLGLVLSFTAWSHLAGPLAGLGVIAVLVWLAVSSIAWVQQPARAAVAGSSSSETTKRAPVPAGSLLEQIRNELDD